MSRIFMDKEPYIIAEIAQAHEGSLGLAEAYIKLAASVGASAVKFQTHYASEESSQFDEWRVKFSNQDKTRYDYWSRLEFTPDQWRYLAGICDQQKIDFISSPFSEKAVKVLQNCDVPYFKIASGEVHNIPMLERIHKTGKPVLISTGLSDDNDLKNILDLFSDRNVALLHCVSEYPTPPENINLQRIAELQEQFPGLPVGLSDHSGEIYPSIAALGNGVNILELHLTFDKLMFGPDTSSSLTPSQFRQVTEAASYLKKSRVQNVDVEKKAKTKSLFGRSAFYKSDVPVGTILKKEHIIMKKPGEIGMNYTELSKFFGRRLENDCKKDTLVTEFDFSHTES